MEDKANETIASKRNRQIRFAKPTKIQQAIIFTRKIQFFEINQI